MSVLTRPLYAFSLFSNCMTCYYYSLREASKQNLMDNIKFEIDNRSSVVLSISPDLNYITDEEFQCHAYILMDYNQEQEAVKLYDPRCIPKCCVSNKDLPLSLTENADSNKGELWVKMDQLKKREVQISALHSKTLYKSVLQIKRKIKTSSVDIDNCIYLDVCKVVLRKTATFMINIFSYTHNIPKLKLLVIATGDDIQNVNLKNELTNSWCTYVMNLFSYTQKFLTKKLFVKSDYNERRNVEINCELPNKVYIAPHDRILRKGEPKTEYYKRFKLQPNTYIFKLVIQLSKDDLKDSHIAFMMKIGSVLECTFKKLKCDN